MQEKTIYALGFFDGVHLGHQALLAACRDLADSRGANAGVVTFAEHPDMLVLGNRPALINTQADRKMLLRQYHMDTVTELPFDRMLMTTPWEDFICMLQRSHGAAGFVCGSDFRFGHKGQGTAELLQQYCRTAGLPCAVIPEQLLEGITVSSTHIRKLLQEGKMAEAVRFLGHPHVLTGQVVAGKQLGRTIGIPTANLLLPAGIVELRHGVYACKANVDGTEFLAVTNIGTQPTVSGEHVTVEAYLLDFAGDLYGKTLRLSFYEFLRPEQKFDSLEELQAKIQKNIVQTRKIFEKS